MKSIARQKREEAAARRIGQVIGWDEAAATQRLASTLNHLYADWFNAAAHDQADAMTEHLSAMGATVRIAHYTGDNSYPTEYTIEHPKARAMGPTFDLALAAWIQELLKA
jgi:hypothetical protein